MRNILFILTLAFALLIGCNKASYRTVKQVKPVNYNRSYVPGKDKRKKRVKVVKMKELKRSKPVKPPREKPPKKKKLKEKKGEEGSVETEEQNAATEEKNIIQPPQNEPDSTGLLY